MPCDVYQCNIGMLATSLACPCCGVVNMFHVRPLNDYCLLLLLDYDIHTARGYICIHRIGYCPRFSVLFKFNYTHVPLISSDGVHCCYE